MLKEYLISYTSIFLNASIMENIPLEKKKSRSKNRSAESKPAKVPETSAEHLGHMLMTASEKAPVSHTGKSAVEAVRRSAKNLERSAEHSLRPGSDKRTETLNRAELLSLSEQIVVDGSSLRQIYETHLVGEHGLRRLIDEHLHGGDLRKALRREIIEREIDFERDPAIRDMPLYSAPSISQNSTTNKANQAALNKLLDQAAANIQDSNEEAAFFKARALYEAQQLRQHQQQRRLVDIGMTVAIAILVLLVIILLSRR